MTNSVDYQLVDADNHYYEPDDCFTRHIENEFADCVVHVRRDRPDGIGRVYWGEERLNYIKSTPADVTGAPGAMQDFLRGKVERGSVVDDAIDARQVPALMERDARLKLMQDQNLQSVLMLPTLGVCVEHQMHRDVPALYANLRSFNRWLEDDWGYGTSDPRIIGIPLLSLVDLNEALRELERVIAAGARVVDLRPGPVYGMSPADPMFDPFWACCAEAGVVVAFHTGDSGLYEFYSAAWGEQPDAPTMFATPFQHLLCTSQRAAHDTFAALVLHGLFNRHAKLRVASLENGSDWVPRLLKRMDKEIGHNRNSWDGGQPSDLFREHVWVAPFHEEEVQPLIDAIGVDRVLFGSDYPHPEGLADPRDYFADLAGVDDAGVRKIMRDNTVELVGLQS